MSVCAGGQVTRKLSLYKELSAFLHMEQVILWTTLHHGSTSSRVACVEPRESRQNVCDCDRFALTGAHQPPQAHESETNWPTVLNKQNGVFFFYHRIIASWIQTPAWRDEWRAPAPASSARRPCWRRSQRADPPGWQGARGCLLCCPDGSLSQQAGRGGALTSKPWLDTPAVICSSSCVPPTDTCGLSADWRGRRCRSDTLDFSPPKADWLLKRMEDADLNWS